MSNVNIKRAVENIRANTTVYTPIVEVVVNAIQAIEKAGRTDGAVAIRVQRSEQKDLDGLADVESIEVEDNGVGFTDEHLQSFDTLYTDLKADEGGKGFGRFTCLKYFEDLGVSSIYTAADGLRRRHFSMGKGNDIVVDEVTEPIEKGAVGSTVRLGYLKEGKALDKKLKTIARNLVERLLPYFITKDYVCPSIRLTEMDGTDEILLNDYLGDEKSPAIREIVVQNGSFVLGETGKEETFVVRVFKFYYPKNLKSRVSLVAHQREVSGSAIHKYVPEFIDEFYDKGTNGDIDRERNYLIKAYVFGKYLDRNVSLERSGFEFQMERDLFDGISQVEIEARAAEIAKDAVGPEVTDRQQKKRERVQSYVDSEAPWHKAALDGIDLGAMPYNATNEEIESTLQKEKFGRELQIKKAVAKLLSESDPQALKDNVVDIVSRISETSKNDLVHYIALRRNILDIFEKSLQTDKSGSYSSEGVVHDIIFPRKADSDTTSFEDHNLWIVDERMNFTSFVSSDEPLNGGKSDRPDLLVYNRRILFRGDNEPSNPVTIFEFKKPQRDDFVNPSSKEDPVQQIVRYVNAIRAGAYLTPQGRKMLIADNTPFYGYVVCDLTPKVETWLRTEKNFKPMPDRLGWFDWLANINLYVEVLSWDKVLKDAKMRNRVFFEKLGI